MCTCVYKIVGFSYLREVKRKTYFEIRRDALGNDKTTIGRSLSVVFDHKIIWIPDPVGILRGRVWVQWCPAVSRQGRHYDAVLQFDLAIGNLQRLEELGV